jgi:hypothetical protein
LKDLQIELIGNILEDVKKCLENLLKNIWIDFKGVMDLNILERIKNFRFEVDERMSDDNIYFSSYLDVSQKRDFYEEVIQIIRNAIELNNPLIKSYDFSINDNNIILSIKLKNHANNIIESITSLDGKYLDNIDGTHYINEDIDTNKLDINNIAIYVNVQEI